MKTSRIPALTAEIETAVRGNPTRAAGRAIPDAHDHRYMAKVAASTTKDVRDAEKADYRSADGKADCLCELKCGPSVTAVPST